MSADDFRDLALRLNGATEGAHMRHPDFRAGGRIFASLHGNEETGTVKLTPDEQREIMRAHPRHSRRRPVHGAGKGGRSCNWNRPMRRLCEERCFWPGRT